MLSEPLIRSKVAFIIKVEGMKKKMFPGVDAFAGGARCGIGQEATMRKTPFPLHV